MGRVRENIEVNGRQCWTLFDTGARNTYIVPEVAPLLLPFNLKVPHKSAMGGGVKEAKQAAVLEATIVGCPITTHALVLDEIGRGEEGKMIEVLFGALAMRQWGIRPIPDLEKLDTSHYSKDFVEF